MTNIINDALAMVDKMGARTNGHLRTDLRVCV